MIAALQMLGGGPEQIEHLQDSYEEVLKLVTEQPVAICLTGCRFATRQKVEAPAGSSKSWSTRRIMFPLEQTRVPLGSRG